MRRTNLVLIPILLFVLVIGCVKSYPQELKADEGPDFEQKSKLKLTNIANGVGKFEATIRNNGSAPATPGVVESIWEKVEHGLELSNGEGILNESFIGLDLNGNGKENDTFEVRWSSNETRPYDATVDGVHVYSLWEKDETFNFSVNGISKCFQLGDKLHALAEADQTSAVFLLDVVLRYVPCPSINWILSSYDRSTLEHVTISDFRINAELVEANFTHDTCWLYGPGPGADTRWYIIPNQVFEIGVGEELNLSCILTSDKTVKIDLWLLITWSPDNVTRYVKNFVEQGYLASFFQVKETTTTSPTTLSTTTSTKTSPPVSGFSFFPEFPLILLFVFLTRKKKQKNKSK